MGTSGLPVAGCSSSVGRELPKSTVYRSRIGHGDHTKAATRNEPGCRLTIGQCASAELVESLRRGGGAAVLGRVDHGAVGLHPGGDVGVGAAAPVVAAEHDVLEFARLD